MPVSDIQRFIKRQELGDAPPEDALQAFFDAMAENKVSSIMVAPGSGRFSGNLRLLSLGGRQFRVSRPIRIRGLHGVVIANGSIEAADQFPEGEYLFDVQGANTLKIENVLFECNKRANGIYAQNFLRLRIEDCTILHQKDYGIYGSDRGRNHELEVMKCNIVEYLWGDDASRGFPDFRRAANRTSVGVFLGQADNVVADCNINLCRTGIKVGMRANRIQGNHITGGNTIENEVFDGIVLDKHVRSSCLVVNNYIDNCRLLLNVNDQPVNARNYVTVTDNLFYKGYNHPTDGREFNHIVVRALAARSILQNVIISNNQFYNQDEHLEDQPERRILPIRVEAAWPGAQPGESATALDAQGIAGTVVRQNVFTNVDKYHETPVGTRATIVTEPSASPAEITEVDFGRHLVWGDIYSLSVTMIGEPDAEPVPFSATCRGRVVRIRSLRPVRARFSVTVDVNRPYGGAGPVID
jgi:hypothetical protein